LDEMCNLWERDVKVYFDLHVGGPLLTPFLQGETRGQIRSLHRDERSIVFRSGPVAGGAVPPKFAEWLNICPSSALVNKAGLLYKDDFRIVIRIDETYTRPMAITPTDSIRREVTGAQLLDARHGDIIFRFPEPGQPNIEEKTLFASSDLLCKFSAYFKQLLHGDFRESSPESLEFHVKYDTDPTTNLPALRALLSGNRKVIPVLNARFTDYHNILYYIYTGSLNLRYPKDGPRPATPLNTWDTAPGFPRPANPNEIYRLAGVMGLMELQGRAHHYLSSTCSVDNIFDRLFDPYCKAPTHAPVRSVYQKFLARNWEVVRASGQWHALLRRYRSTQREDEAEHLLETMVSILNSVTWDPKAQFK